MQKGKSVEAMKALLDNAPVGSKDQAEKDAALSLFMKVMLSIKRDKMADCVKNLNDDQKTTLMKYIYRGFEKRRDNHSAHLLVWHEHVFNSTGLGSIVRALTDRKQI